MFAKVGKVTIGGVLAGTAAFSYYNSQNSFVNFAFAENQPRVAIATLRGEKGYENIKGWVKFTQVDKGKTTVEAYVESLMPGQHGIHIHEFGNLTDGCTTAGPHFNPENKKHGGPKDKERHVGDMGNIESKGVGIPSILKYEDNVISLEGEKSIVGRSVVLHLNEGRGNFPDSPTTGHSGPRIACGVIGRAN